MGQEQWEQWKRERNEYFRLIRVKKREAWEAFLEEERTGGEKWTVWKMASRMRQAKTPTIDQAVTFQEKEELFRRKLFPSAPEQDDERTEAREEGEKGKGETIRVEREQVRVAFQGMGGLKAPGKMAYRQG